MRKFLVFLLVMLTAVSLVAQTEYYVQDVSGGTKGGTLFLQTTSGPRTYNYAWSQESSTSDITAFFMESLMQTTNRGQWADIGLAKEYWFEENEMGGTSYYFRLREGVKWSDGTPFTVEDVMFSWENIWSIAEMTANGNDGYKTTNGNLPTARLVDSNTIAFDYPEVFRNGFNYIGGAMQIYPKHVFQDRVKDADGNPDPEKFAQTWTLDQIDQIVALGAFIPTSYQEGVRIVLERNPNFWHVDKDGVQLPYLDRVEYAIIPDLNTGRLRFEAGQADLIAPTPENFPSLRAQADEKGWDTIIGGPVNSSQFIAFNFNAADPVKRQWFRDVNFRMAVAYAFDRDSVIDNIYQGLGEAMYGPRSRSSAYYNAEIEKIGIRYSLIQARRTLQAGGYTWQGGKLHDSNGNKVTFTLITNAGNNVREEIGNVLVDSLNRLGMEVIFRPVQFNALVADLYTDKWDSLILGLTGGDDPGFGTNTWTLDGGLHFWNWSPERYDWVAEQNDYYVSDAERRIDEILRVSQSIIDPDELQKLWDEWQMLIVENQILIHTVSQNYLIVYNNKLNFANPAPNPLAGVLWRPAGISKAQ
jgi:peptide/nickel transport system substrate-binding protein